MALVAEGATLLIESVRPAVADSELDDAIARLAPHLAFGPAASRDDRTERSAVSGDERVVVGRLARGTWGVAYVLFAREPIDIDDVVATNFVEPTSPFAHLTD